MLSSDEQKALRDATNVCQRQADTIKDKDMAEMWQLTANAISSLMSPGQRILAATEYMGNPVVVPQLYTCALCGEDHHTLDCSRSGGFQ